MCGATETVYIIPTIAKIQQRENSMRERNQGGGISIMASACDGPSYAWW